MEIWFKVLDPHWSPCVWTPCLIHPSVTTSVSDTHRLSDVGFFNSTLNVFLQVDLGTPSFPHRLLNTVARRHAAVIADLDALLAKSTGVMATRRQWALGTKPSPAWSWSVFLNLHLKLIYLTFSCYSKSTVLLFPSNTVEALYIYKYIKVFFDKILRLYFYICDVHEYM